jgi:hypothetical protein
VTKSEEPAPLINLDRSSPHAGEAAELARSLVTARLAGQELADTSFVAACEKLAGDPVAIGYALAALTTVVAVVLEGSVELAEGAGRRADRLGIWQAVVLAMERAEVTI